MCRRGRRAAQWRSRSHGSLSLCRCNLRTCEPIRRATAQAALDDTDNMATVPLPPANPAPRPLKPSSPPTFLCLQPCLGLSAKAQLLNAGVSSATTALAFTRYLVGISILTLPLPPDPRSLIDVQARFEHL
jgi:hypothetical protein